MRNKGKMSNNKIINKSMDREDLDSDESLVIIDELNALIRKLKNENLKISSWYGAFHLKGEADSFENINRGYGYTPLENADDDTHFPWFLYWEIAWIVLNSDFRPGQNILDLGGSSSLFSFYLASKGYKVEAVDLKDNLVENGNFVAGKMNWKLKNHVMDINDLKLDGTYDHITSLCVFEHIPLYKRIQISKKIKQLLKPGGRLSITFDYLNPSKLSRINSPGNVHEQFVVPSGLVPRGNKDFYDNGKRYLLHPFYSKDIPDEYKIGAVDSGHFDTGELGKTKNGNDYTFGALFLENRSGV